jgi:hypothetical protein
LDAVEAAEHRARRAALAAVGEPSVVLALKAGASSELLAKLLHAYAVEPGSIRVDVTLCGPGEQARLLRNGRADVAILHQPYDDTAGFDIEEIHVEGQVAILPAGHVLTTHRDLTLNDLADVPDLPLPRWPGPDGTYPAGPGPEVQNHTQLLQLISLGRTLMVSPDSCRSQLRDDVIAVPVADAPQITTVIAWPPHSRSRAVADLVRTALRL